MKNSGIEWIGNIPDDTKVARLKYFVDVINGFAFQSDKFSDYGEINVVRISDIKQNYDFSKCVKYENFEGQENYMIKKDDILMAMSGGTYGKTLHLKNDIIEKNAINQRVCIIRGEQNIFNKYLFQTSVFFDYLSWRFMGAAQPNISAIDIGNFPIVLFEKSKAYIVANYLDGKCGKIDELIANQEKQIEKLKKYKQSVITEAVTKGLDKSAPMKDSGIEWIGEIPESWGTVLLSSLFVEHKCKNTGMQCNNLLSLSYGKIKRKDINGNDGLLPESFEGYNIISEGDIVLRLTDLQNDQRSLRTGLCTEEGIVTSAYVTLRKRNNNLSPQYMHYFLHSFDINKGFYAMGSGVRQGLNYEGIRKLELLFPTIEEQFKIVAFLNKKCSQIEQVIKLKEEKIEKMQEYKKSLIYEYVTGKKEVV